ncbi:hypothetical protein [Mucilaginibacter sp. SP1R1]|uniref:hypothetical protein n=1 Tax=Mucilaginibacter sp. SP1R1 TaxID=2723091 RepID=UPI001C8444DC|nr:hypothetical protein [Mucilaginibacter sp. SP1R1]
MLASVPITLSVPGGDTPVEGDWDDEDDEDFDDRLDARIIPDTPDPEDDDHLPDDDL